MSLGGFDLHGATVELMGSSLAKHTSLIENNTMDNMESGRLQIDYVEKQHKSLPGVGQHVVAHVRIGTLCTQSCVFGVHLVASCATVAICADVTGC